MSPADQSRPTLLFVHGAWHGSWCWHPLRDHLHADGWETRAVDLPSVDGAAGHRGLRDDAQVVAEAIGAIDGPVVVVAHSYGGMPTSEGAAGQPNVEHLVYVAAFMLDVGQSVLGAVGGHTPPWWDVQEGTVTPQRPREVFFNDLPDDAAEAAAARLSPHSLTAFTDDLAHAAWHDVPTTYVVCEQDQAVPPAAQEGMSGRASTVVRVQSGHSPYLSRTSELAEIIVAAAGR